MAYCINFLLQNTRRNAIFGLPYVSSNPVSSIHTPKLAQHNDLILHSLPLCLTSSRGKYTCGRRNLENNRTAKNVVQYNISSAKKQKTNTPHVPLRIRRQPLRACPHRPIANQPRAGPSLCAYLQPPLLPIRTSVTPSPPKPDVRGATQRITSKTDYSKHGLQSQNRS